MVRLLIAGIPRSLTERYSDYKLTFPNWDVRCFSSNSGDVELKRCWPDVLRAANELAHDGAHIFAFDFRFTYEHVRVRFEKTVYPRHRLLWLEPSVARSYGTPDFQEQLQPLVEFEHEWRAKVRPRGLDSSLMLPEGTFEPETERLSQLWNRSYGVRRDKDEVDMVIALDRKFRQVHYLYLRGHWRDKLNRRFKHDHSQHARAPQERRWKFTFRVPETFHFDVSAEGKGGVSLCDHAGTPHFFKTHANVDCHGFVWGGR